MMRTQLHRTCAVLLSTTVGALLEIGMAVPVHADMATESDPRGDAPARLDIASATYRNTTPRVSVRIRVPGRTRAGCAEFYITTTGGTDVAYVAIASNQPNGTLRTRFVERGNRGDTNLKCDFEARRDVTKNFIHIAVPRRCVPNAGADAHHMRADMSASDTEERDYAPVAQHPCARLTAHPASSEKSCGSNVRHPLASHS